MKSVRMKNWSPKPSFRKGCVHNLFKYGRKKNNKMKKIKILLLMSAIAISSTNVFSQDEDDRTTTTCDASNQNECVITNVGKATGRLIVVTNSQL